MSIYYNRVHVEETSMSSLIAHINEVYKTYRLVSVIYDCNLHTYIAILEKEK